MASTVPPGIAQYMSVIQNDPMYKQTLANNAATSTQAGVELGNTVVNDLVQLGFVPDINTIGSALGLSSSQVAWLKSNIDWGNVSQLVAKANAAGVTETAQLGSQHNVNMGNIQDALAARGIYRSGALPSDVGREGQAYTNALYNAYHGTGGAIDSAYGGYLNTESGINTDNTNALTDAYTRALALYPNGLPTNPAAPQPTDTATNPPAPLPPSPVIGQGTMAHTYIPPFYSGKPVAE